MPPSITDNPEAFFEELNKPQKEETAVEVSPIAPPVGNPLTGSIEPAKEQPKPKEVSVADDPETFFAGLTRPLEQKEETPQNLVLSQLAGKTGAQMDDFDMQSLNLLSPKELEEVTNTRRDIPLSENLLRTKFDYEMSLPWNEGINKLEDWKKIGQEVFGGGVSFLKGAQKFAEQSLFADAEQDPSGWGHPSFKPVKDYASGIASLPESAAYLFTKLKEGGMGLADRLSESIGVQDREKSYENYKARNLVDRIQAQETQENPSIYSRILKGDMANDALAYVVLNTLPDRETLMAREGLTAEQADTKRKEIANAIARQTTSDIASREKPADEDIATFATFTAPAGLGLGEMGLVSLGLEAGMGLAPKVAQGIKYLGKTDQEIKAMNDAAQALQKEQALQGLEKAQKPSMLGKAAGALATGIENTEAAFAKIGEATPNILKELAPPAIGAVVAGDERRGEGAIAGAVLGKAGRPALAALKYAAKTPALIRDIEEARVLAAGGSKGTFETLASFPEVSENTAKILRFGGRRLDNTLNNVVEYAKAGVNPTLIALATGSLDSASPEELNKLTSTGLLYGLGGRAVHQAWGKITGVDPVIDARNRRQQDIDDLKTYRDLDPETRKTLDSVTSWDNIVERHTQRAANAEQAYNDAVALGKKDADKLGKIAQAEKNILSAVTRANVQTRDEFSRQFVTQLTKLNQLVNGTLRAGQNNVGINILTPEQIVAKFRSDPANATATDQEVQGVAEQRGFYSTPEGAVEYQAGMGMEAPKKKIVFDRTKPSVVINADALKARMMIEGSTPIDALNHEVGHHVRNIPEFREANKDAERLLFSQEVRDLSGRIVDVTTGQYSEKALVEMYLNDYLKDKTPEQVIQLSQLARLWDYSREALNESAVAEYMKDEIIAELNAETFSTHLGKGLDDGVLHMIDVARLKTKKNLLDRAVEKFFGLGGKGDATSDLTGATFSPEILAANRQAMRALQSLQGEVSQAVTAVESPKISRAETLRSKALMDRYGKYAGLFKTKMQGQIFDGNGNPIGAPIDITNPNASEGSWESRNGETKQLNGYGARPDEVAEAAGVVIPDGGRLVVQKQIVTQPDGVTPVVMTPKEAKDLQKARAEVIRESLNTPDEGAPNRFEAVNDDSETWRGTFTPLQIQAIKDMPEGIIPKSIKENALRVNEMIVRGDGSRMLVDYAPVMNDAGKYVAFSPKIYDVVPIGMHLSKAGNFLVTTISVGRMFDKLNAWSERMPARLAPWGGSKDAFFKEFTEKYLQNWQYREKDAKGNEMYPKGRAGETGLSGSPEEALAKKDIFNDFLNLTTNDFMGSNADRTKTPRRRGDVRGKNIDRTIMSMRLDHMAELMDNDSAPKVPINYKNAISNFMPAEETAPAQEERRQTPFDGITATYKPASGAELTANLIASGTSLESFGKDTLIQLAESYGIELPEGAKRGEIIDAINERPIAKEPVTENAKSITRQYGEYPKGTKVVVVGQRSKDPLDTNIPVQFPDGKVEKFPISWLKLDSAQGQSSNLQKLVKDQGRDAVNILLGEWDQNAVLNPDGTGIISAVDPRESMKKTKVPTSDFTEWLKGQDIEAILASQGEEPVKPASDIRFMPDSAEKEERVKSALDNLSRNDLEDSEVFTRDLPNINDDTLGYVGKIGQKTYEGGFQSGGFHVYAKDSNTGESGIRDYGSHELFFYDNQDNPIGFARLTKDPQKASVSMIAFTEENRGQGNGTAFYKYLLDDLGVSVVSDAEITDGTKAIYEKLLKDHDADVTKDGRVEIKSDISFMPAEKIDSAEFKDWFGNYEEAKKKKYGVWGDPNVSKVVDSNGNPLVVYHGSDKSGFTIFGKPSKGFQKVEGAYYFAENKDTARSYARGTSKEAKLEEADPESGYYDSRAGLYPVYLDLKNPYEYNMEGANWDGTRYKQYQVVDGNGDIIYTPEGRRHLSKEEAEKLAEENSFEDAEVEESPNEWQSTDSIVRNAMKDGYDGVIIRDVVDQGGTDAGSSYEPTTIYVAFDPTQIKSATQNVGTYSKENPDIRFMPAAKLDEDYLNSLRFDANPETAQKLVDQAAEKAGYDSSRYWYHGTAGNRFNVPKGRRGVAAHVSLNKDEAWNFAESAPSSSSRGETKPDVRTWYLKRGELFDPTNEDHLKKVLESIKPVREKIENQPLSGQWALKKDTYNPNTWKDKIWDFFEDSEIQKFIKDAGFIGYMDRETPQKPWKDFENAAIFDPNSLKEAGRVTLDDQNNIIPLSQRFDTSKSDIRFMPAAKLDETYAKAIESGDLEEAQRLVDEEVSLLPRGMYHGGTAGGKKFIALFVEGEPLDSYWRGGGPIKKGNVVSDLYTIDQKNLRNVTDEMVAFASEYYSVSEDEARAMLEPNNIIDTAQAWDDHQFVSDLWQEFESDFLKNGDAFRVGDGAVAFPSSERIRRIDTSPATYDNEGNLIPLSQRFDTSKPDIRFMPKSEEEENREKLVAKYDDLIKSSSSRESAVIEHYPEEKDEDGNIMSYENWVVSSTKNDKYATITNNNDGTFDVSSEEEGMIYGISYERAESEARHYVERGQSQDQYNFLRDARSEIMHEIHIPTDMVLRDVRDTANDSIYYKIDHILSRDEDGDPDEKESYKLSIRNHDPSPFREQEFGANDYWVEVPKNPYPIDMANAVAKLEKWLADKSNQSNKTDKGQIRFMPYTPELPKTEDGKVDWEGFKTKTMEIAKPLAGIAPVGGISFMPAKKPQVAAKPQAGEDDTYLKKALKDGKDGKVKLTRPFRAKESLPTMEQLPVIGNQVDRNIFKYNQPAEVIFYENDGTPVSFKWDGQMLVQPEFKDIAEEHAGKNVQLAMADRQTATGGDMGGVMHTFLKSLRTITIKDPLTGNDLIVVWANNEWKPAKNMKDKVRMFGAKDLLTYLMGEDAHASNARSVRRISNEIDNSGLNDKEIDTFLILANKGVKTARTAEQNKTITDSLAAIEKATKALKKEKSPEKIDKLKKDIKVSQRSISDAEAKLPQYEITPEETEFSQIIKNFKSSFTGFSRGTRSEANFKAKEKEFYDFLKTATFTKLRKAIRGKRMIKLDDTFKGRKAAVQNLLGLTIKGFNIDHILPMTADFKGGRIHHIVSSVELSTNPELGAVYLGEDPEQAKFMSPLEAAAAAKIKADPNFVVHEAYAWGMLGPVEGNHFLNTNPRTPEEYFPAFRKRYAATKETAEKVDKITNASESNLVNTMRDQKSFALTISNKSNKSKK